jgi:hypothetical protein
METHLANGRAPNGAAGTLSQPAPPEDLTVVTVMRELRRLVEEEGILSANLLQTLGVNETSMLARGTRSIFRDIGFGIKRIELHFCRQRGLLVDPCDVTCASPNLQSDPEFAPSAEVIATVVKQVLQQRRSRVRDLESQFQRMMVGTNGNATLVILPVRDVLNVLLRALYELEVMVDENVGAPPMPITAREYIG